MGPGLRRDDSRGAHRPFRDRQPRRLGADSGEQAGLGPGHPDLPARLPQPFEQSGAAGRVEMGGNLVEQKDRPPAGAFGDEIGMGQDQADQERLLLAGRGRGGGLVLAEMGDGEIGRASCRERVYACV